MKESDTVRLKNMELKSRVINADRGVQWTVKTRVKGKHEQKLKDQLGKQRRSMSNVQAHLTTLRREQNLGLHPSPR